MFIPFDQNLIELAGVLPFKLYAVGGYVRNYLYKGIISKDVDICSKTPTDKFIEKAFALGFKVVAEYKRTGTVVIKKEGKKYEYTVTRTENYLGGEHSPCNTEFGVEISLDALRRDFKCNAVYCDISNGQIVDPLNGVEDIKMGVLSTTVSPDKVFSNDGLRLMRLARFSGELGFSIDENTLTYARKHAKNVCEISSERIFDELKKILVADNKYPFSPKDGHYRALKVLERVGVLDYILPELTLGKNMVQRSDYHNHDVLEHSLRCVLYASPKVRLSALLHDIGKPRCMIDTGKYHNHQHVGEEIAKRVLSRLRVDKCTLKQACFLVKWHMLDLDCLMKESKVRLFIVKNFEFYQLLVELKIADFIASMDQVGLPPTVIKWKSVLEKMKMDGTPFSLSQLKISAKTLTQLGYKGKALGEELNRLFELAVTNPNLNDGEYLVEIAKKDLNTC